MFCFISILQKLNTDSKLLDKKFRELEHEASTNIQNMKNDIMGQLEQARFAPEVSFCFLETRMIKTK
jgi:hypothetical protein